jgi:hypothetical protein
MTETLSRSKSTAGWQRQDHRQKLSLCPSENAPLAISNCKQTLILSMAIPNTQGEPIAQRSGRQSTFSNRIADAKYTCPAKMRMS